MNAIKDTDGEKKRTGQSREIWDGMKNLHHQQKSEIRMSKSETNSNNRTSRNETPAHCSFRFEHSRFGACFELRISDFDIFSGSPHARDFGQGENRSDRFFPGLVLELIDRDRVNDIEAPRFCAAQCFQVRATPEGFADVMNVSANIETFAADDAEIDFGKMDPVNAVPINMDQARLALDDFSLARQLVEGDAAVFFGRDHRRQLIKIAAKLVEGSADLIFIKRRNRFFGDHFTLSILGAGGDAQSHCPGVFLVLAH